MSATYGGDGTTVQLSAQSNSFSQGDLVLQPGSNSRGLVRESTINSDIFVVIMEYGKLDPLSGDVTVGGVNVGTPVAVSDGSLVLDVLASAIRDVAQNFNPQDLNVPITELADVTRPVLLRAHIDFNDGYLSITADEYIDSTPAELKVDPSKICLSNAAGEKAINLNGSDVIAYDGFQVNMTIPEAARVAAIAISATPGGDSSPVVLDADEGALFDIAGNSILDTQGIQVEEVADTTPPTLTNAALNYSTGILVIETSETIDATPADDNIALEKIFVSNVAGQEDISLQGAQVVAVDALALTITLTELQRVTAIAISSTPGGDGTRVQLGFNVGPFSAGADIVQGSATGKLAAGVTSSNVLSITLATGSISTTELLYVDGQNVGFPTDILDPGSVVLDVREGAFFDIGENNILSVQGFAVEEAPDVVLPVPQNASIDFNDGTLILQSLRDDRQLTDIPHQRL